MSGGVALPVAGRDHPIYTRCKPLCSDHSMLAAGPADMLCLELKTDYFRSILYSKSKSLPVSVHTKYLVHRFRHRNVGIF